MWYLHCPWCETYLGVEFTDEEGDDLDSPVFDHMAPACPDCGQQHHMVNCHHYKENKGPSRDGHTSKDASAFLITCAGYFANF